jgi:AbrB family looped-hinge helix DNA binding protein
MAVSVKMSSKNQIVVPKEAREALGLRSGDRLLVTVRDDGVLELEKQPEDLVDELEGALRELADGGGLWAELRDE